MKAYENVLGKIIEIIEKNKILIWEKDWVSFEHKNYATKREYIGFVNKMLLSATMGEKGYIYPFWLTFRQISQIGYSLKKGEKGVPVSFFKKITVEKTIEDEDGNIETIEVEIPILKYFVVFNIQQLKEFKEIEWKIRKNIKEKNLGLFEPKPNVLERLLLKYCENENIKIVNGKPSYVPSEDTIRIIPRELFKTYSGYLATFAHECVHSTGMPKRLNRFGFSWQEKEEYAFEELVAEIGASYLMGKYNIDYSLHNSAAYIKGWVKYLKEHKKALFMAAAKAEKAIAYIEKAVVIQNKDVA